MVGLLGVASTQMWPGAPHPYARFSVFLTVDVYNGHVRHSPLHLQRWQTRARNFLALLTMLAPRLPNTTFLAYLHDGCPAANLLPPDPPFHFAIGVTESCSRRNCVPLPYIPQQHNPLFDNPMGADAQAIHKSISEQYPFENKIAKAVWRGRLTDKSRGNASMFGRRESANRARACLLTTMYPYLIDARAVETSAVCDASVAGNRHRLDFYDFFKYKYILDINGAGSSFRVSSLLLGNSIVLLPAAYQYFFSDDFRDAVVYVADDLHDVVHTIEALEADEARVSRIRRAHERVFQSHVFDQRHMHASFLRALKHFPRDGSKELQAALV